MAPETIKLYDDSSGVSASILAGFGFNCFSFQPIHDGQPVEILWTAPGFENGQERPSGSGIPILFPFPGRVRGAKFRFEERTFELEPGDAEGNAIHGFVFNRPWNVVEQTATRVVGCFHASKQDPELLDRWPADFRLRVTYELRGNSLRMELLVENPGDRPLPWGLGTHPYFRIPLAPGGDARQCKISVPAGDHWELVDMLPTGKRLADDAAEKLTAGVAFADASFDDVFSGLRFNDGKCTAVLYDPRAECTLSMTWDETFPNCVVYNPPHREAICIEPYTCVPGLFGEGDATPIEKALNVMAPGQSVQLRITIQLAPGKHGLEPIGPQASSLRRRAIPKP